MPFPTSNISADSIRNELASNNTGGVQTPVTLNDIAVRAAANRPSGTVSYGDLSGVNVLFSGLVSLNRRTIQIGQNNFILYWGYFPNFTPQFGGPIGSLNTASYYRTQTSFNGGPAPLISLGYNDSSASGGGRTNTTLITFADFSVFPVNNISINFGTTRITAAPRSTSFGTWEFTGDPFGFVSKGSNEETYQIVITYT